jgi:plastocyanin
MVGAATPGRHNPPCGTILALPQSTFFVKPLVLIFLGSLTAFESLKADAAIEGLVQLPEPKMERPLNARYQTNVEAPLTPTNPPSAVVYLEGDFHGGEKIVSKGAEMAQKNIAFAPDLIAVHVGTVVDFPNMDDTYHNVFSYSKTKRFDLGRFRKDEKPVAVVFDKPGVVTVHCEIHDRMRGVILVLETPYFKKTDSAGRYRLEHLPAGHFLLKAWVSESEVREKPVDLKDGTTLHIDFPGKS